MNTNQNTLITNQTSQTKIRVLLVEDNLDVAAVICELLQAAGFETRHAATASEGLVAGTSQPPTIFVLDVDLPDADGFQLCRALKSNPRTAAAPVIFCTGRPDARETALAAGGVDCLAKPFEIFELPARIRQALTGGRRS